MIAVAPSSATQTSQHTVEGRVSEVGHDDRDRVRLAEDQAAGERAGGVVEFTRGSSNLLGQCLIDRLVTVHHSRDRGQ